MVHVLHVVLFCHSEEDPELRKRASNEAVRLNGSGARQPSDDNTLHTVTSTLLGLGDKDYPLAEDVLRNYSNQKAAVMKQSASWNLEHGTVQEGNDIPDVPARMVCSDICRSRVAETGKKAPDTFLRVKGLLRNICRSMKEQVADSKRHLSPSLRHPILLGKTNTEIKAWLITQPTFKPLTFDAVHLSYCSPTLLRFETETVGGHRVLKFCSADRVAMDLTEMSVAPASGSLSYCFTRAYSLRIDTELADLHLSHDSLGWVNLDDLDPDDGDEENDEDDDGPGDGVDDVKDLIKSLNGGTGSGKKKSSQSGMTCSVLQ